MLVLRLVVSSVVSSLLTIAGTTVVALADETSASAREVAQACNSGRNDGVTSVTATVNGEQGTFYFYRGIGRQTAGNEQCTTYFLWLERTGNTVTIP